MIDVKTAIAPTHNNFTGEVQTATGPKLPQISGTYDKNGNPIVSISQDVANPFVSTLSRGIRADVNITVTQDASSAHVQGTVSGSPSFEANFTREGVETQNVPLQQASQNSVAFAINLQRTNQVDTIVKLEKPKEEEKKQ